MVMEYPYVKTVITVMVKKKADVSNIAKRSKKNIF